MTLEQVRMYLASETVTPEQADHYINAITAIEQDRIIRLLENEYYHYLEYTPITFEQGKLLPPELTTKHADDCQGCYLIAAIKEKN